jgi:hypothetical protein
VTNDRWGFGCAVGDFDNDGWPDIYVGNYGKNRLYHNNHDGTFTDIAETAGVTLGNWSTGPSFGDYDGDGRLDIFVPGYIHWDMNHLPASGSKEVGFANCQFRGAQTMCGPRGLQGEPDHLFHNNGDGTFTDVSEKAGVSDKRRYYGFSSTFVDIDDDGKVDLIVADDSSPNYLYINKGDGTFQDASFYSGFALNQDARETASMGVAVGDYLNNGRLDLYTTTFSDDYKTLYRNYGDGNFVDVTPQMGIAEPTYPFLSWGTAFFDLRQRRLERSYVRQRPCLPPGGSTQLGNFLRRASAAVSQPGSRQEVRGHARGRGHRPGRCNSIARRCLWRPV